MGFDNVSNASRIAQPVIKRVAIDGEVSKPDEAAIRAELKGFSPEVVKEAQEFATLVSKEFKSIAEAGVLGAFSQPSPANVRKVMQNFAANKAKAFVAQNKNWGGFNLKEESLATDLAELTKKQPANAINVVNEMFEITSDHLNKWNRTEVATEYVSNLTDDELLEHLDWRSLTTLHDALKQVWALFDRFASGPVGEQVMGGLERSLLWGVLDKSKPEPQRDGRSPALDIGSRILEHQPPRSADEPARTTTESNLMTNIKAEPITSIPSIGCPAGSPPQGETMVHVSNCREVNETCVYDGPLSLPADLASFVGAYTMVEGSYNTNIDHYEQLPKQLVVSFDGCNDTVTINDGKQGNSTNGSRWFGTSFDASSVGAGWLPQPPYWPGEGAWPTVWRIYPFQKVTVSPTKLEQKAYSQNTALGFIPLSGDRASITVECLPGGRVKLTEVNPHLDDRVSSAVYSRE